MRINVSSSLRCLLALAFALLLATTIVPGFGGTAQATSTSTPIATCLLAAPPTQQVPVDQPAKVAVTIDCLYPYLVVTWGDGTFSQYPVCLEVCRVPPFTIEVTHTYTKVGDYRPELCLAPSPVAAPIACTSVEILVL
ncbi:MAG TPA: hypothetical protein VKV19_15775 [Ktedonobacteraceae bacterium]|nr:hypothetical protein [Ktedonobacteraceae bacterium]